MVNFVNHWGPADGKTVYQWSPNGVELCGRESAGPRCRMVDWRPVHTKEEVMTALLLGFRVFLVGQRKGHPMYSCRLSNQSTEGE